MQLIFEIKSDDIKFNFSKIVNLEFGILTL